MKEGVWCRRTGAGHGRGVGQGSVVAVLAVAAPRALAVVEAVRWAARALQVLGGRLVEAPAARCGGSEEKVQLVENQSAVVRLDCFSSQ